MKVTITYDDEFDEFIEGMKEKYGEKILDMEGIGTQLDTSKFVEKILSTKAKGDHSVDSNANVTDFMPATLVNESGKPYHKLNSYYKLWKQLSKLYTHEIANNILEKQITGSIYINDFSGIFSSQSYCYNFSCMDVITKGLPFVNKIITKPPKHMFAFKSQLEQFIAYASNSIMGASGIADVLICFSWYMEKILETKSDSGFTFNTKADVWKYLEETLVSLIYTLNQPFRSGIQSPFTNVSLYDREFLKSLHDDYIFPDGKKFNIEIVLKVQEVYIDIMNKEHVRTPLTFPVTTVCFATDDDNNIIDQEFLDMISIKNMEFGFMNIYCGKSSVLSSCCRLRSDKENPYFNSFGAGSSKIGSLGVVTCNFPRLAYTSSDLEEFNLKLKEQVQVAARVNNAKRHIIQKAIDDGHLPLYSLGFMDIKTQYSTFGINGIYEALEILGFDILSEEGQQVVYNWLAIVDKENDKYQTKFDAPHNVEQVPSESSSVKLASKDKYLKLNKEYDLYSNQFVPLITNADLLDRIHIQGKFDGKFSGGAICHLNVDKKITDYKKIKNLITYSAKKGVIYFAINYNLQHCANHHFSVGTRKTCPICKAKITDNYIRVVGFLVNTKNFNPVRRQVDYPNRQMYDKIDVDGEVVN